MVVPDRKAGRRLVRTLKSKRQSTPVLAVVAERRIASATLGRELGAGDEQDGGFVLPVLTELRGTGVERVALVGLRFSDPAPLRCLESEPSSKSTFLGAVRLLMGR